MASPFHAFRKNQKVLTVWLIGLSMFAFIFLDILSPGGKGFPIVLGLLLGGLAGWLLSGKDGKEAAVWSGLMAIAGAVFVWGGLNYFGNPTVVDLAGGGLDRNELTELQNRRDTSKQFFGELQRQLAEDDPNVARLAPPEFDYAFARPTPFGTVRYGVLGGPDDVGPNDDLLFGYLLGREAEDLGLRVTDEYITDRIQNHFGKVPTRSQYKKALANMEVGESGLYDALRGEFRARRALELLVPTVEATPLEAWDLYRRMNQRADVVAAAVPVEPFLALAPEPTDAEVAELFEANKERYADPDTGLGFVRPPQLRVASLRAEHERVKKSVEPPTDAQVREFYDAHRTDFRNPEYDLWLIDQGRLPAPAEPRDAATPDTPPALPSLPQPGLSGGIGAGSGTAAPAPVEPDGVRPDGVRPDGVRPDGVEPDPVAAGSTDGAAPPAAPGNSDAPAEPDADAPDADEPGTDEPAAGENGLSARIARGVPLAFVQDDPDGDRTPRAPLDAPKPVAAASPGGTAPPAEAPKPTPPPDGQPPAATTAPPADLPAETPDEAPMTNDAAPAAADTPKGPAPAVEPPEFRPLEGELLEELRAQLYEEKVRAAVRAKTTAAENAMYSLAGEVWADVPVADAPDESRSEAEIAKVREAARQKILARMKAYAEKNGLAYEVTPFLDIRELAGSKKYAIGRAETTGSNPFGGGTLAIASLFERIGSPPFAVGTAVDPDTQDRFVFWKVDDREAAVPTLEDEGVRGKVVAAYKKQKARALAEARATALAEMARKSDGPFAEALAGQTVTGKEDGPPLKILDPGSFRWMRQSAAPNPGLFQQPRAVMGAVPEVGPVDPSFMKSVFNELEPGDVGVAPDAGRNAWYAFELEDRSPDGEQLAEQRPRFLREAAASQGPYAPQAADERFAAQRRWVAELFEKYGVNAGG